MNWLEGLGALIALTTACAILPGVVRFRKSVRQSQARFRLYGARDRLYLAAANGLIPVDSEAFRVVSNGIVALIREADSLGIGLYERMHYPAGLNVEGNGKLFGSLLMPLSRQGRQECIGVVIESYAALLSLMQINSRLVRWAVRKDALARHIMRKSVVREAMPVKNAIRVQEEIDDLRARGIAAAA